MVIHDPRLDGHWQLKSALPPWTPFFSYQITDGAGICTKHDYKQGLLVGKPLIHIDHVSGNRWRGQHLCIAGPAAKMMAGDHKRSYERWFPASGTLKDDTLWVEIERAPNRVTFTMIRDPVSNLIDKVVQATPRTAQRSSGDWERTPLLRRRLGRRREAD